MKLGLSSLLFPGKPVEEVVEAVAKLGFQYLEVIRDMPHFTPGLDVSRLKKLRELIDSHGLGATVHASFWDLNPMSHYPVLRELAISQTKDCIRACDALGGDVITVHPGRCWFKENGELFNKAKNWYKKFIAECLELSRELGITLAVESGSYHADYPHATEEFEEVAKGLEGLGVTLDVGHVYISATAEGKPSPQRSIIEAIQEMKSRLANVHLHDNHGTRDEHLPPGRGEINFEQVLGALKESNYNGPLTLEPWNPSAPLEAATEALGHIRALLET
jgi:sugar phosphate isomerase/epimerase